MINEHVMPLMFMYAALVSVLLTYVVTRKLVLSKVSKTEMRLHTVSLPEDGLSDEIPPEIARQLSVLIRYRPLMASSRHAKFQRVHIEERLMLGTTPLTAWVKHERAVANGIVLDGESLQMLSRLRLCREKVAVKS